ncbi:MAG: M48 family metalloprotease, partial [Flavobacteriaceae bacterium]
MKKLFLLLFAINFISHGQKSIGIELCLEYQNSIKSFSSNSLAENALDEILNVIGVAKNFYLIPCDDISNALAITFKGERYIIYDKDFINDINNSTSDWSGKFILAHEVGHHINGHTRDFLIASVLDDQTKEKQKEEELEADEFAGFIIAKLGASFYQIKELMDIIASENDDEYSTHPSRSKRIEAMKRGFNKARVSLDNSSKEGNITKIESNTNQSPLSEVLSIDFNNEINWLTMNEALAKQKEQPKKIMIDMYTVWCGPCK